MFSPRWELWYVRPSDGWTVQWPGSYYTRKRAMNAADRAFSDWRLAHVIHVRTGEKWIRRRGTWFKAKAAA
jgi:hypothetical protein